MKHFIPCSGCARHVRASDATCPFCGEVLPLSLRRRAPRLPGERLGRAATFAFGAALAASTAAGCGDGTGGEDAAVQVDAGDMDEDAGSADVDAGVDSGQLVAAYGGPPDAGPDLSDAGTDAGGIAPADGGPIPVDAGPAVDSGISIVPAYGGPMFIDAGSDAAVDSGISIVPAYGLPPSPE